MVVKITLPIENGSNAKDIIFTILTKEYPLRIIDLTTLIKRRYGKSVTFQAVRKAILSLKKEGILTQEDNKYLIDKNWVTKSKNTLDELYNDLTNKTSRPKSIESIKGEVTVFTFSSLNEMVKFWEEIIDNWYNNFKKGNPNINCWQGSHPWEALIHMDTERKIMGQLKKKGIKSYVLSTSPTPLDKNLINFYKSLGLKVRVYPSASSFDKSYYVATYGETIVQAHYPKKIVERLDNFFKNNKSLQNLDLHELTKIVNSKAEIKLTVIKNLAMAKQINKSIMSLVE